MAKNKVTKGSKTAPLGERGYYVGTCDEYYPPLNCAGYADGAAHALMVRVKRRAEPTTRKHCSALAVLETLSDSRCQTARPDKAGRSVRNTLIRKGKTTHGDWYTGRNPVPGTTGAPCNTNLLLLSVFR